jgi:beta-glucanase (GH16 family)
VEKKNSLIILVLALLIGGTIVLSCQPLSAEAQTRETFFLVFRDDFESFDTTRWHKADGWTNGDPFDAWWQADNASFSGGVLSLQLDDEGCPGGCGGVDYASGEYRSNGHYSYGVYTVRMKAVAQEGVVSTFFIYTGPSEGNPWDEIDIEITGRNPYQMQTNYFTDGVGDHEYQIDLGFDSSADFHTYSIEWMPDTIRWYVDGSLAHTEDGSRGTLPSTPGRIMLNFWPGADSINIWLGDFVYDGPIQAKYDWVSYEAVDWPIKSYIPAIFR